MRPHHLLLTSLLLGMSGTAALADSYADGAIREKKTDKGTILTDAKGMTLYTFDKDPKDVSVCFDDCAKKWPPLEAKKSDRVKGDYKPIARKDGTMQWSHDGKPLYRWQMDKKPGDMTGDGVGNVWHIVKE
ncbi:COG4315 family predicted lipoprotein [Rhizobium paknamense]|uniref:Lipoprotein with Yx(FWY)xxD motif n=1 Tax=Rhizobium paknamense TaxID=1206817 RepID=A0ABU0IGE6_9HYPH|nr:hypothetical protein [Rhizobium paknamense]MDQ0456321.1 putative lipoprotein with Yx(FWY)xxD motif [Rhizobium paknamense]